MRKWNYVTTINTITALISKLTLEITGKMNQMKCDAEHKASYLNLSWARCFCVQAASGLPAQRRARTGAGRRQCSGRGVYTDRTRVCTTHVKMTVCTRVFLASHYLKFLSFTPPPPKQNIPNQANEKKPLCDKEARTSTLTKAAKLFWPTTDNYYSTRLSF